MIHRISIKGHPTIGDLYKENGIFFVPKEIKKILECRSVIVSAEKLNPNIMAHDSPAYEAYKKGAKVLLPYQIEALKYPACTKKNFFQDTCQKYSTLFVLEKTEGLEKQVNTIGRHKLDFRLTTSSDCDLSGLVQACDVYLNAESTVLRILNQNQKAGTTR